MREEYAKYLLNKTQQDYNRIADHFSKTRAYVWDDLKYLTRFVSGGEKVLDLGCGNGRLFELFKEKDIDYVGVDNSERLIEIAKKQSGISNQQSVFIVADALNLPFENNYFDKVFSVAVFHHIPSKKLRTRFLEEAKRVLRPEGLLILTVWNLAHRKFIKHHLRYFFLKLIGKSRLDFRDIFYPWKNPKGEVPAERYVHCFTKGELRGLAQKADFKIEEIGFLNKGKRNIHLIAKKSLS